MCELREKLERYLRVNLLGPGPRLIKKNLLGRGLTKFEKHSSIIQMTSNFSKLSFKNFKDHRDRIL